MINGMNIHYSTATGQIMCYGNADYDDGQDSYLPGCKVLITDMQPIDPTRQRIDPATRRIVTKAKPDVRDEMPSIRTVIVRELADTDKYMMPDYPIDDAGYQDWLQYRKALRELSKQKTVAAMLDAWPVRPDGVDAAEIFFKPQGS
jgi:hypothetical protein